MKFFKPSIVALKISFFVCIFIIIVFILMANLILKQIRDSFIKEMSVRAEFFARGCKEALFPKTDEFLLHFQVQEILKEKAVTYASVQDNKGKFLSHSDSKFIGEIDETTIGIKAISASDILIQNFLKDEINYFDIAVPVVVRDFKVATVRIGFTDESIKNALKETKETIFLIAICIIGIAIAGTTLIVGWMINPLKRLAVAAGFVEKGNFDIKVKEKGNDEIAFLSKSFNKMVKGLKEREIIREMFGKYVSPEVANTVLKGEIKLGGERREVSILISDIRDFTALSEKNPPEKVVEMLNIYLTEMVKIIVDNNGIIDKFIGDAIFAVFGAPVEVKEHTRKAVESGILIFDKLSSVNENFKKLGLPEIKIGIAIHTGVVIAGNIGSKEKIEYTCIGDTVNTTARIEGLNREWKTSFLISEDVYERVKDLVDVKKLPPVLLKGKETPITVYEVLSKKTD